MDAMGIQKDVAPQIVDGGGDSVLAIKDNHPTLHKAMSEHFDQVHEEDLSKLGCDIIIRDREEYCEIRFYLSRLPITIKKFASAVRANLGIENSVHWVLDMTFNEDQWRIRKGHSQDCFCIASTLRDYHP
jgi:predicted transposase YbfD/YdcC